MIQATIEVVGVPVACETGFKDGWRDVAGWLAEQLGPRFGSAVQVRYFDLFDPGCPTLPSDAQLPLVFINGDVLSSGAKISLPAIRRALEAAGLQQLNS